MAILADEANVSQEGKLNVMGIFDRIAAAEFPVMHPKMVFAFRVEAAHGDGGRGFPVNVELLDPEGAVLFQAGGEMMAPRVPAGEFTTSNQVFTLVGLQFPRAGLYRFVVTVGDAEPHETPFLVQSAANDPMMN
jgi:hypothetical protein